MKKIYLSSPHLGTREMEYVQEAFESNWIAPVGENITAFQEQLADFLGNHTSVTVVSSGTAAIHLALVILDVEADDEVICQSFTFSASVNPILYQHAKPVLVDSEKNTWNMCPKQLERAIQARIKNGKKPKAIILVDLYGMPCNMKDLLAVASKYEIPVIEDAAEALGSEFEGHACGTFGEMGILSFNGNKIITASAGGAIVSKNPEYISLANFYAGQSKDPALFYKHSKIGYNYQLSNVLAGIGRGQMEVLPERVHARRHINDFYRKALSDIDGILFQTEPDARFFSNYWLTTLLLDPKKIKVLPLEICEKMNARQIECRPVWNPMHLQPIFQDVPYYGNGVSDELFNRGICLPSGSNLSEEDLHRVVDALKEIVC